MKSQKSLTRSKWLFLVLFLSTTTIISSCNKDSDKTYTVTVGVYILNGSTYEDQNKDLIFETQEGCQSWSRTAQADNHSSTTHDHFNAATNTTYDANNETISWTEYGPELDQSAIDATCEAGVDGAVKTANKTDYIVDKNFYLKIKSAIEN